MILTIVATLAIVVQDHTWLRAAPRAQAAGLVALWQGDVLEIRGESAGYFKVYDYRRERGGYLRREAVRTVGVTGADAPELLAVLRFLRDSHGFEALGISYGAAYLKAVPARALTAEPFDAIARMAERLADDASVGRSQATEIAAHLEVVEQFGVHMRTFEHDGRVRVCYDGELFRRVLTMSSATAEQRAEAALGLTRPECIDPDSGPSQRAAIDQDRRELLYKVDESGLTAQTRSRVHARRAGVLASLAFEQARRGQPSAATAERALSEVLDVNPNELGEDRRSEYVDAVLRVSAVRWAVALPSSEAGPLRLSSTSGEPGQTCLTLEDSRRLHAPLARRCTYGVVWMASAQAIPRGSALVVAVQPLESWRELWLFHEIGGAWIVDVLSPGADDPEEGYVEFAGFVPLTRHLLVAREVRDHGHFRRFFEELRLDDLALVRQASAPELLRAFGRWQDVTWRRDTLALH
jgi:hypothetical protein